MKAKVGKSLTMIYTPPLQTQEKDFQKRRIVTHGKYSDDNAMIHYEEFYLVLTAHKHVTIIFGKVIL